MKWKGRRRRLRLYGFNRVYGSRIFASERAFFSASSDSATVAAIAVAAAATVIVIVVVCAMFYSRRSRVIRDVRRHLEDGTAKDERQAIDQLQQLRGARSLD